MIAKSISHELGVTQKYECHTAEPIVLLLDGSSNTINRPESYIQ